MTNDSSGSGESNSAKDSSSGGGCSSKGTIYSREELQQKFVQYFIENRRYPIDCAEYFSFFTRVHPELCLLAFDGDLLIGM